MEKFIEILKKWNPWEKSLDYGIRRKEYIKKIMPYLERKEVLVLKGIRRCGKSTIIKQIIEELIKNGADKSQILYLNLEDYGFANYLSLDLFESVLKEYKEYSKNKGTVYFFIDEAQKIPSWEQWVRTKYDLGDNIKFIITGSSAHLLSKELSTLLTGRNISFTILPLSFKEFCQFKKSENLEEYMEYGGFPEVVLEDSEEKKRSLLQQYLEDILYKDIVDRYNIRDSKQLLALARYLISSSGSKVSVNKLSKVLGIAKDTIQAYIFYMISAYILFDVTYFSFSAKIKHEVSKLPKIYCIDNGLISIANTKYTKERGRQFENTVLLKLLEKYKEISYWGELKSEVDFIINKTAINVTSTNDIPDREFIGLEDFKKEHKNFSSLIVSDSLKKEGIIPIRDFLKQELEY